MTPESAIIQVVDARAEQCKNQIKALQGNIKDRTFELADLLAEVMQNSYYRSWGYSSFKDWIEDSELDVKLRQAEYLIRINLVAKDLQIGRDKLRRVKITKLKAIFSLNPQEFADQIRDLVSRAPRMTMEEVEKEVRALKGENTEEDQKTWRNFYVNKKAAEETIDPAIEEVKIEAGSNMSDGEALELLCANQRKEFQEQLEHQISEIEES